jgi:spermidine synthase
MTERGELVLRRVEEHFEVISNGVFLMDTRDGRSERLLVRAALDRHPLPRRLLIGGLGVGFSLVEAVGDPRLTSIDVVEIEPALLDWHDGALRAVSDGALHDPRVTVSVEDLRDHLAHAGPAYDLICVDVDNGPDWTVTEANAGLYGEAGLDRCLAALRTGGVLAVWSADAAPTYEALLRAHLDDVRVLTVEAHVDRGGPDVVYLGRRRH